MMQASRSTSYLDMSNAFLQHSRSAPVLGPGRGRPHSARIVPPAPPTAGPGKYYDEVNPRIYKQTTGHVVPRLNSSGNRIVPLNPPTEGADALYDPVDVQIYKEKDKGFRFDKAFRFNEVKNESKFRRAPPPKHYTLPAPEVYKERVPTTPKWKKGGSRFGFQLKPQGADSLYNPAIRRAGSVPNLSGGGPRIDVGPMSMYIRGAGADAPFYDLPHPTLYKERSRSFRFGRDESAPSSAAECAPRHRPAPVPAHRGIDPDAPAPKWVDRLAVHTPRPVRPWTAPKRSDGPQRHNKAQRVP